MMSPDMMTELSLLLSIVIAPRAFGQPLLLSLAFCMGPTHTWKRVSFHIYNPKHRPPVPLRHYVPYLTQIRLYDIYPSPPSCWSRFHSMPTLFVRACADVTNSITVAAPLDVIKVRVQNRPFDSPKSGMAIVRKLLATEGPGAFFKGLVSLVLSSTCAAAGD